MPASVVVICSIFLQSPQPAGAAPPASGMVPYQLVILTRGPAASTASTPDGQKVLQAHVSHLYRQAAEGGVAVAGPFLDGGDIQGILFVNGDSAARAEEIEAADPAVKAGIFRVEPVLTFYSPEGRFGKWAEFGQFETVYFGFLDAGPNRGQDPEAARRLQSEHLAYMDAQAKAGKLVVAGPFASGGAHRGLVVYRVDSADEAKRRAEGDPAVKLGRLAVELHSWQVPKGALPAQPR